jgi:hypothetical protein
LFKGSDFVHTDIVELCQPNHRSGWTVLAIAALARARSLAAGFNCQRDPAHRNRSHRQTPRARRRLKRWSRINFVVANAAAIPASDDSYDAVTRMSALGKAGVIQPVEVRPK